MRHLTVLMLALSSTPAFAAAPASDALTELQTQELPQIAETGIAAFDSVFMKAKAIHDTLDAVQGRILGVQNRVAAALALPEGTPIRMTMWELKQRAGGPLEVQMQDGKPYLTVGGTGSDEVKAMIDAVNKGVADLAGIPTELAKLPPQVQELVAACQGFPAQLNPALLAQSGLSPMQLPKIAKQLATNVKAVVATPKRLETLAVASKDLITGIPQGIAATEPPEQAVQVAVKGSDEKEEKAEKPAKEPKAAKSTAVAAGSADGDGGTAEVATTTSPISAMVGDALAALGDAEVESAMNLLGDADASLARLAWPIPSTELENLYQTVALVHLVDGNSAAATASVAQALVIDPTAKPNAELGPEYAKLHKALAKSGVVHMVRVDVNGEGVGYISGRRIEGGETVDLGAGKHLLQIERGGTWTSQLVWISEGADIEI